MAPIRGTWTKIAESDRLKRSSQNLAVVGQQVYVYGGEVTARVPIDGALELINFNGSTVTTSTLPNVSPAPTPRVGGATAVLDGVLYLFSGRGGLAMTPIEENGGIWKYTSSTGWEFILPKYPSTSFPLGRSYHAATASQAEGLIYIHAGCPESGRLSDLWSYNPKENVWIKLPDAPGASRGGSSICCFEEFQSRTINVARINGYSGTEEIGGIIDIYSPRSHSWERVVFDPNGIEGPGPRSVGTLLTVRIEGKQYLFTMFGEGRPSPLGHAGAGRMWDDAWIFDIEEKSWQKVEWETIGPAPRGWFAADVIEVEGKDGVVLHGGLGEDNERLGDVWLLKFN
ncbi:hypothetical protein TWF569_009607 [Orbilia oligospora]|uniref:Kelch repeat protein n=2 Tax=Orbilia oligospora TaxID=2813651 RepID=A0A7C8P9W5_ORBOL|nr:hypothetical protein TWF706_004191 [Orbilia oligospora]KAF3112911.1 hypothetical protein TWF102_004296 [Orbilia oligospora]KAF3117837.1 hypothetical protein TWF103_004504 [Orbilia oligospora]KAF3135991.1 hypothetical protein TWF569_009607 [Orbilia oligospora]KAF3142092.1 hypothetical protein TWF703_001315 [Orbilia oligospora]